MKKFVIFSSIIIFFISYLFYNEYTIYEYSKKVESINASKNQQCKIYPSNLPIETFVQLNDELFVGGSTNYMKRFQNFKYLDHVYEKGNLIILNKTSEKLYEVKIENFPKNIVISPDGLDFYNGKLYVINQAY